MVEEVVLEVRRRRCRNRSQRYGGGGSMGAMWWVNRPLVQEIAQVSCRRPTLAC